MTKIENLVSEYKKMEKQECDLQQKIEHEKDKLDDLRMDINKIKNELSNIIGLDLYETFREY